LCAGWKCIGTTLVAIHELVKNKKRMKRDEEKPERVHLTVVKEQ